MLHIVIHIFTNQLKKCLLGEVLGIDDSGKDILNLTEQTIDKFERS
jgi:hypothetical protein